MIKNILLYVAFFSVYNYSFGQITNDRILYIVDSIPVIKDPEYDDEIEQDEVADITIIKNKDSLKFLGYEQLDGIVYLFTKAYRDRPENIRQIPSSKQMKKINGVWFFYNMPYSGKFIDYYYNGRKQGEGFMKDGKVDGYRLRFYQNGNVSDEWNYSKGIPNGILKEYFEDGAIKQKGEFINGKEEGIWENYYPNGQIKLKSSYKKGAIVDSAFKYYSNGKIMEEVLVKNGKIIPDANLIKINLLMDKSNKSNKEENTKAAIKYCSKAIETDSTYASAYFSRGTIKLNDFQFDNAIADFDKAIMYEPFMETALTNRAFARIRKYQYANSRTLSENADATVMASEDKVAIPPEEMEKICNDLHKAIFLGAKSEMIAETLSNYCR